MSAKRGILMASVLSAALLGSGCNNPDDTVARGDTRNTPPIIAPGPPPSVGDSAAVSMGDTALTAKVKAALIAEPGLKSMPIDVSTKQSVVTLSGAVASPVEKAKALQVAENVEGVKSVVDNLVAKS